MKSRRGPWLWMILAIITLALSGFLAACERPVEPQDPADVAIKSEVTIDQSATEEDEPVSTGDIGDPGSEETEVLPVQCPKAKKNLRNKSLGVGKCVSFPNGKKLTNTGSIPIKYSTDRNCELTKVDLRNGGRGLFQGNGATFDVVGGTTGGPYFALSGHNNTINCTMTGGQVAVTGSNNTVNNVNNGAGGTHYTGTTYPATSPGNRYTTGGEPGNFLHGSWRF